MLYRYGFGRFFTEGTIVLEPFQDDIKDIEPYSIIKKQENILSIDRAFINTFLDPSKDKFLKNLSTDSILLEFHFTKNDFDWAFSIFDDSDNVLHSLHEKKNFRLMKICEKDRKDKIFVSVCMFPFQGNIIFSKLSFKRKSKKAASSRKYAFLRKYEIFVYVSCT